MVSASELQALRESYAAERPVYEALAGHIAEVAGEAIRRAGIYCRTESRAKDVASLIKKAIRKGYAGLEEVPDRAGARVILAFADSVPAADDIVGRVFEVRWREDKSQGLSPDQFGYLGIHYGVSVRQEDRDARDRFGDRVCELQLHTTAQRAWADVSHELLYKPDASPERDVARVLYRLMALMEVFDESVVRARETLKVMPDWKEAAVLGGLEQLFLVMTAREFDRELSLTVLRALVPAYGDEDAHQIESRVREFVNLNGAKIERIFREYGDDLRHPMLFQPETLLVFERLEADPFTLKDQWQHVLPLELLEGTAEVWGVAL